MHDLAINNGTIVSEGRTQHVDVGLAGGQIAEVAPHGGLGPAREYLDASELHVFPGAVDVHFHCRAPSHPERGTFNSETRAAAAGGVTTILEMPVSNPPCSTPEVVAARRELGESECHVNFGLFAGGGLETTDQAQALVEAGAIAFKIFTHKPPEERLHEFEGLWTRDESHLYSALEAIATTGAITTIHAENQPLIEFFARQQRSNRFPLRPPIVEAVAIAQAGAVAASTGARIHIAHITSAHAVAALTGARAAGADATGETCPHYLIFDESNIERYGPYVKVAPPLRPSQDLQVLWKSLRNGEVQVVSSDHAPFTPEEKRDASYATAPQGLPAVETMLGVVIDAAVRGKLTIEQAVSLVTDSPARRFGLYPRKGTIQLGADADLVLWDSNADTDLSVNSFFSKAGGVGLPYEGMVLAGRLRQTILRGQTVFKDGKVIGPPTGRFVPWAYGSS